jgi:fluoride exporter
VIKNFLLVGLGGAAGSMLRYFCLKWIGPFNSQSFPLGTLTVNCVGCLLIGVFFGIATKNSSFSAEMQLLAMTGFCGGFTTFSAFTQDGLLLLQQQRITIFFLYFAASVILGLGATILGYLASR